ncbi:nesprin-1-like, partial [Anneissia japonica]|uniref:nesprin-1-like n=1 Tax=Anneissia japonica TaxID=1529436 RepID=UPI0014255698
MNETGNFLIETCQEEVTKSIKKQLLSVNSRWKQSFEEGKVYMKNEESERQQREYAAYVKNLRIWLDKKEKETPTRVNCMYLPAKEHIQDLEVRYSS